MDDSVIVQVVNPCHHLPANDLCLFGIQSPLGLPHHLVQRSQTNFHDQSDQTFLVIILVRTGEIEHPEVGDNVGVADGPGDVFLANAQLTLIIKVVGVYRTMYYKLFCDLQISLIS